MKQRITSFDTFRAIAAFLIVLLHYPLKVAWEDEILVICRIAVPFFFLVSGYFNYSKELQLERNKRSLGKIARLVIVANVIYLVFRIFVKSYYRYLSGRSILVGIRNIFLELDSMQYILFNFKLAGHLWYLRAMFFVIIVLIIMKKFHLEKIVKWSIPFIIVVDLCFCKYSKVIFGEAFPQKYVEPFTKFIGVGYVYFFTGYFFREIEETVAFQKIKALLMKSNLVVIGGVGILVVLNILEFYWLKSSNLDVSACNYISTFFLVIFMFCYLASNKTFGSKAVLYKIGAQYTEYIYLYHVLAGKMISFLFDDTRIYDIYYEIRPFVLYAIVLIVTMFIFQIKKILKS